MFFGSVISVEKVKIRNIDQDINVREFKRSIGVVPQETNFDPFLTPYETLDIQAGLYGVRKSERNINQLLKRLGLEGKSNAYMRSLSGGMRRRLLIGKALVHGPKVVILDEPTAGVDIELREMLWDYMKDLNANDVDEAAKIIAGSARSMGIEVKD